MSAYYNEIDPGAAVWLRELIKAGVIAPGEVDERDIRDIRPDELSGFTQCHFFAGIGVWSYALRLAGWSDATPVWTGSCPCQPFSAAGKGAGFDDERHLWPAWFHLIEQRRPSVIFGEQVASKDGLVWLNLVQSDLEGTGYACGPVDTCAAGFGAPHIRQRLWFVAESGSERFERERLRLQPGSPRLNHAQTWGRGEAGELADTDGRHASAEREQRGREQRFQPQDSSARELGDAVRPRLEGLAGNGDGTIGRPRPTRSTAASSIAGDTGPVNGLWRAADWLFCRDGKWRPVEPGSFPLAHGLAGRVGLLRGYGNCIVAQAAAEFIKAYSSY